MVRSWVEVLLPKLKLGLKGFDVGTEPHCELNSMSYGVACSLGIWGSHFGLGKMRSLPLRGYFGALNLSV